MKTWAVLTQAVVASTLMMSTGLVGCQKKREPRLGDGEGRYMDPVSQYNGKVFPVTTGKALGKGGVITSSESAKPNETEGSPFRTFPAVEYQTDAKLVDAVPFLAKEGTSGKYEIHYTLTNSHLLVSKVAPREYIPSQEETYAEKLADGRLSVPLFGYPIVAKANREVARNDLGEKTARLTDRAVSDIAQASHVQIDFTRFEEFGAIKKVDTFPVSYFLANTDPKTKKEEPSEWYHSTTVLSAPDRTADIIGNSATFTLFDVRQSLVRFVRNERGLEVMGLAVDEKEKDNKANYKRVAFIPGDYKEFEVKKVGRFRGMKEDVASDDVIHWKQSSYIKLDFANMKFLNDTMFGRPQGKNPIDMNGLKVVSLTLLNNYISIILEDASSNVRFNVAFLKKGDDRPAYSPLIYHELDNRLFGYYATQVPAGQLNDYRSRRESDLEKMLLVNRFNPNQKVIRFHISKSTAESAVPAAEMAIESWNEAFRQAGTGVAIELVKTPRVETGDIRYNVINLIDAKGSGNGGGLFGYGPVLSDPFTGEVISSTSTVHVHNVRLSLINDIRHFILAKTGKLPDTFAKSGSSAIQSSLSNAAKSIQALFKGTPAEDEKAKPAIKSPLTKESLQKFSSPFGDLRKFSNKEFRERYMRSSREAEVTPLMDNVEETVTRNCPNVIKYISRLQAERRYYDDQEIEILEACANNLLVEAMLPTLVHELGHNFGLRHNYAGSADRANFYEDEKGNPIVNTASIMDYVPLDYRRLSKPGKYDIAAIRYAYGKKVQLKDGTQVALDHRYNIKENLESSRINRKLSDLKPYKFCTDLEAKFSNTDPMCELHDVGWTPEQVTEFWMKNARDTFHLGQYRWDRAYARDPGTQFFDFWMSVQPLMKFYGTWREKLAEFMGKKNLYLEGLSPAEYDKILEKMKNDPNYKEYHDRYKPIADKIFSFLLSYSFLPDQYCLFEKTAAQQAGSLDVIEFDKVRRAVFASTKQSIRSCSDAAAREYWEGLKAKFITEFGYTAKDIQYDLSDEGQINSLSVIGQPDVLSSRAIREAAQQAITLRVAFTLKGHEMGLYPSMFDEPQNRELWLSVLMDRVVNGLNPRQLMNQLPALRKTLEKYSEGQQKNYVEKFLNSKLSPRFSNESDILSSQLLLTRYGMEIPNLYIASTHRSALTRVFQVQSGGFEVLDGFHVAYRPEAIYAKQAVTKYMQTKMLSEKSLQELQTLVSLVMAMKLPQSQAELGQMPITKFMAGMQSFNEAMKAAAGEDGEKSQQIIMDLITLFPEIMSIFEDSQHFQTILTDELRSHPEMKDVKSEEEAKKKADELVKKIMNSSPASKFLRTFKPFNMEQRLVEIQNRIQELKKGDPESTAQQELLFRFMLFQ